MDFRGYRKISFRIIFESFLFISISFYIRGYRKLKILGGERQVEGCLFARRVETRYWFR